MTRTVSLNKVQDEMDQALEAPDFSSKLYGSLDSILRCINTIIEKKGTKGWSAYVLDKDGKPLFIEGEQQEFENAFEPFVPLLLGFFDKDKSVSPEQFEQILQNNPQTLYTQSGGYSVDQLYKRGIESLNEIDKRSKEFAVNYGILGSERLYDRTGSDPRPFVPLAVVPPLEPIAFAPVPMRAIVFVMYLIMDTARLLIGFSPIDWPIMRKVLSLVLSIIDLLKGNWKQAILSFSGYYSQNYVIVGTFFKLFIDTFMLISPDLRDSIIKGMLDVSKSLIMGSLLFLFQTFATGPVRMAVMPAFDTVADIIQKNNETFQEKGLPGEEDYMIPNFEHIQNLQALVADPDLICSSEFINGPYTVFKNNKDNIFLKTLFSLLRVPIDDDTLNSECNNEPGKYDFTTLKSRSREKKKKELEAESQQITNLPTPTQSTQPIQSIESTKEPTLPVTPTS